MNQVQVTILFRRRGELDARRSAKRLQKGSGAVLTRIEAHTGRSHRAERDKSTSVLEYD
jgi:hypothetical protein